MYKYALGFLVLFGMLAVQSASADTLSVSNAADGFGSSYTLTADCTGNTCTTVKLTINSAGAAATHCQGSTTYCSDISNVAFKIGDADILAGTLSAPTANWSTITSSLSSSGCTGMNSDGQICSTALNDFADTGGTLVWTWTNVQVTGPLAIGHVGYKYDTSDTLGKGLIVSNDFGRSVPEPASLTLLAAGLGIAGLFALKRR